jgi:flagellin-like protein
LLNKKGISPLIATVLIIGFTIIIAVLVITWINNLVGDQTDVQQCQADAGAMCTDYYNLVEFSAYQDGTTPGTATSLVTKVTSLADEHPDVVIMFLDANGDSLATPVTVSDGNDPTDYQNGEAIDTYTDTWFSDVVSVRFLVKATTEYKGTDCVVPCGEGTEKTVSLF